MHDQCSEVGGVKMLLYWNSYCYGLLYVCQVHISSINYNICWWTVEIATGRFAWYAAQIHTKMVSSWNRKVSILGNVQPIYFDLEGVFCKVMLMTTSTLWASSWLFLKDTESPYLCLLVLWMLLEKLFTCVRVVTVWQLLWKMLLWRMLQCRMLLCRMLLWRMLLWRMLLCRMLLCRMLL